MTICYNCWGMLNVDSIYKQLAMRNGFVKAIVLGWNIFVLNVFVIFKENFFVVFASIFLCLCCFYVLLLLKHCVQRASTLESHSLMSKICLELKFYLFWDWMIEAWMSHLFCIIWTLIYVQFMSFTSQCRFWCLVFFCC